MSGQITPHLVVMWRPDIGKYTGHLQELNTDPNAHVIKDASCNVIPQVPDALAGMGGPLLRAWQSDPWNRNSMYYQMGFDSQICNLAMTNAVGAAWMTKPGPLGRAGYTAIPLFEGVAPTNHAASTECGQDCAFVSKKLMATALVSSSSSCGPIVVLGTQHCSRQSCLQLACMAAILSMPCVCVTGSPCTPPVRSPLSPAPKSCMRTQTNNNQHRPL